MNKFARAYITGLSKIAYTTSPDQLPLAGLAGGAILGAGVGGLGGATLGAVNPGVDEQGHQKSRLRQAVLGLLGGGVAGGAVGGLAGGALGAGEAAGLSLAGVNRL